VKTEKQTNSLTGFGILPRESLYFAFKYGYATNKMYQRPLLNGGSELGLREPTRRDEADAIVVGGGINGLVGAAELAQAGWSVILLERNADIGGFIAAEKRTLPGYLHDTFSSWHPLFVSGRAYAVLGELLHRHGLEYRNTEGWVTASVADDGRATLVHRKAERTAAEFAYAEDRSAYLAMLQRLGENMASIGGLLV
jgi:phytoene dehydrogenase-like protein